MRGFNDFLAKKRKRIFFFPGSLSDPFISRVYCFSLFPLEMLLLSLHLRQTQNPDPFIRLRLATTAPSLRLRHLFSTPAGSSTSRSADHNATLARVSLQAHRHWLPELPASPLSPSLNAQLNFPIDLKVCAFFPNSLHHFRCLAVCINFPNSQLAICKLNSSTL